MDGDPSRTVVAFYDALDDARREAVVYLTHPDGPERTGLESLTEEDYQVFEDTEPGVERTSVLETTNRRVIVEAEVRADGDTSIREIELRPSAGQWRVWEIQ